MRNLLEVSDKISVPLARLPRMSEIKQGITDTLDIKPIAVEDLLGRPQNTHDKQVMRGFIEGKVVMITGAGGSIGSELCHQVAQYGPTSIILLEYSEYNLYRIDAELAETHPTLERKCIFADVRDTLHIDKVMAHYHPDIVFHAAAIKHVHIAEHNPEETIFTNVFGTKNVADACVRNKVGAMILISTDKAVNPTSVMGASKRVAESYCQALGQEEKHNATRFITVRFGNVLGSTGSVVPLFYKQLEKGGPITITHPDMMRYFMTIREAVELVIYAAAMGEKMRDQNGMIFVLDMGQPVRIVDLAVQMIKLAGLRPNEDIAIEYTGLRPGEKLHEELFHFAENSVPTSHESILLAAPRVAKLKALEAQLLDLLTLAQARKTPELIHQLQKTVAEYSPSTIF